MNKKICGVGAPLAALITLSTAAQAGAIGSDVSVTAVQGDCANPGESHAHATAFFNKKSMRNVISTNNEFQRVGGDPVAQDTMVRFDIWEGRYEINGPDLEDVTSLPGDCVGHIEVFIPGGSNQAAQFAIEDYLDTPADGQGVIVRTGQLDVRSKFDIYVDIEKPLGHRQIVWNNFVGMPNNSGEMSIMRFERGQYFSCVNSGDIPGRLQFQVFDVDGNFVAVTDGCDSAPKSVHVTPDVTSLDYYDLGGNPVDVSSVIGRGFVKMTGVENIDGTVSPFTSAVSIYQTSRQSHAGFFPYWLDSNSKLGSSTITFARRNSSNDSLNIGE